MEAPTHSCRDAWHDKSARIRSQATPRAGGHSDGGQWTRVGGVAARRNELTPEQVARLKWAYLSYGAVAGATDAIADTGQRVDPLELASDAAQSSVAGASLTDVASSGPTLGAQYAETRGFSIDLTQQEAFGGHTIRSHVGKSESYLLRRTTVGSFIFGLLEFVPMRAGSFPSLDAATRLVNSTLSQNTAIVDLVASGQIRTRQFITGRFSSPTGIEAHRNSPRSSPYIRTTYGVAAVIRHAPNLPGGFLLVTAYPRND